MAGVEDSGRCLMDEINALFAPPGRGVAKNLKELHPYYKRPGKINGVFSQFSKIFTTFKE